MLHPNETGVILHPYLPITAISLQVRFSSVPKVIVLGGGGSTALFIKWVNQERFQSLKTSS